LSRFEELKFSGEWRRYQRAALAAFERDLKHGNTNTHIVAPPGSGKTLLGVELIRRVGKRALVLAPNQAIQQQWPRAVARFTPAGELDAVVDVPADFVTSLSFSGTEVLVTTLGTVFRGRSEVPGLPLAPAAV